MNVGMHIQKNIKITSLFFSIAFITTATLYWSLNYAFHTEVYYLGITVVALLFPFLISVAYGMAVSAKRAIDNGIKRNEEELEHQIAEMRSVEKENDE